ncbi:InlB B-repeat-containing protein, partial [Treponema lecithinolyticum]
MKSYSKNKAFAFLGAAFVLFIAVFTGCPQTADGGNTNGAGKPEIKPKHNVSFSVDGAGGTLKAKADGVTETGTSPVTVEQDKIVTFTAVPAAGYKLKEWKVDGTVISNTSNTYTHSVTTAVDVKVSFQLLPPGKIELTLSPDKLTIKVKATTADGTTVKVEGCTETELASGTQTELNAKGRTVIFKGKITKLEAGGRNSNDSNKLIALNAQGCAALQELYCSYNQLTELNVQGLTALQKLVCFGNKLTELNVQGLS